MNHFLAQVTISSLTDQECRGLLLEIKEIVSNFPSFRATVHDDGYGQPLDVYGCCGEPYSGRHDIDCPIKKLESIFGF